MDRPEAQDEVLDQIKNGGHKKRTYQPPLLEKLGDLRSLTLGSTLGMFNESTGSTTYSPYQIIPTSTPKG